MPRRISSRRRPAKGVRSTLASLLDEAIETLAAQGAAGDPAVVHMARKRCKESRALARLLAEGHRRRARRFDVAVRDASRTVAALRDSRVVVTTIASLAAGADAADRDAIARVAASGMAAADATTDGSEVQRAVELLRAARAELDGWSVRSGFGPIADGLERSYRTARRRLRRLREHDDDAHLHEWRKAVKQFGYQLDAVSGTAPSVLDPSVAALDRLSELLGDDHDLTVLIECVTASRDARDGDAARTIAAARARQAVLRADAVRLGASLFAETPGAFRRRLDGYRSVRRELGPEPIHPG